MRKCFVTAFVLVLLVASASFALEKTAVRATNVERPGTWNAQTTCSVAYYNFCTGWLWVWSGWSPYDVVGVCYNTCCDPGETSVLMTTWERVWTGAPTGYGFTGVIEVRNGCDYCVSPLAGQPFYFYTGWNGHAWGFPVADPFLVTVEFGPTPGAPTRIASDHPAIGPTGPQACGYCYPMPRTCHSFYYGTSTSPLCPGTSLTDGVCCVEWYWDCALVCEPVGVEQQSWTNIKALYK
jgi:hypothetical protein